MTPIMPKNTAVPSACRISWPGPLAKTSGTTPRMKANDVIRIGRSRVRAACSAAVQRVSPRSSSCLANSTIRIAFFAASPTSTTSPICVRILSSKPRRLTPRIAASRHIGTIRMTANGSTSDSYCAASSRKTNTTASAKTIDAVLPCVFC